MSTVQQSLAIGSELTAETWDDFVERLRYDCVGKGVEDHYTADAIFTVQAKQIIFGIDREYTDQLAVCVDDHAWYSIQEYWDDCDDEKRLMLDQKAMDEHDCKFLDITYESWQWDLLGELDDHTVAGWDERWEYVCSHFTKDAAEAFIRRKKHDYRLGLRVYVDAQVYCWEYNAIKEAILSGKLVFKEAAHAR